MKVAMLVVMVGVMVVGCSTGGPAGLPGGAVLVDERPEGVLFKATENGRIYLRDVAADRVVMDLPMKAGQTFSARGVDVMVDGKPVPGKDLRADAMYQLFFKVSGMREYHPAYNP